MLNLIERAVNDFLEKSQGKIIRVISHLDTDGITSATIIAKTLKRLDKQFSIKIVKQLELEVIESLSENDFNMFLDLGSSFLPEISKLKNAMIIDHHEITSEITSNITIINPYLINEEVISGAGLSYLFAKQISSQNQDLANLAVIGMIGDMLDRNLSKLNNSIINDAEVTIKKGLLFYPSTRPIHKTLEFSSSIFIPGVTGNAKGAIELLREAGIERVNNEYKSLIELNEEENSRLITSILLRRMKKDNSDIIGNIYLVKLLDKLEDARELSAMINACSRLGCPETALALCLGSQNARKDAEALHTNYKQHIVSALNIVSGMKKIEGRGYMIINAKDQIMDTIIGTIASILSVSSIYEEGTIIIAMAYSPPEKIKVSARIAGRNGRNAREILESVTSKIGGECGGHPLAAGCIISKENEQVFTDYLTKILEVELVKV